MRAATDVALLPARADRTDFPDALEDSGGTILQWVTGTVPTPDAEVLSMSALEVLRNIAEVGVLGLSQLSVASLVLVPLGLWSLRGEGTLLWCGVAPAVVVSGISTTTYGNYGYWHLPLLLVGGILTGSGASRVAGALRGLRAPARTVAAVVGCAGLLTSAGAGIAYLRSQLEAITWARETLEKAPRGAVIEGGWTGYTVLRATQSLVGSRPDIRVVEGEYWVTAADLDAAGTPLLAAIAFQPMRSNCTLTVTPLGRTTPTNVKGLTNVHFLGVQLGPDQTIAQLIRVAPGGGGASCSGRER